MKTMQFANVTIHGLAKNGGALTAQGIATIKTPNRKRMESRHTFSAGGIFTNVCERGEFFISTISKKKATEAVSQPFVPTPVILNDKRWITDGAPRLTSNLAKLRGKKRRRRMFQVAYPIIRYLPAA